MDADELDLQAVGKSQLLDSTKNITCSVFSRRELNTCDHRTPITYEYRRVLGG